MQYFYLIGGRAVSPRIWLEWVRTRNVTSRSMKLMSTAQLESCIFDDSGDSMEANGLKTMKQYARLFALSQPPPMVSFAANGEPKHTGDAHSAHAPGLEKLVILSTRSPKMYASHLRDKGRLAPATGRCRSLARFVSLLETKLFLRSRSRKCKVPNYRRQDHCKLCGLAFVLVNFAFSKQSEARGRQDMAEGIVT